MNKQAQGIEEYLVKNNDLDKEMLNLQHNNNLVHLSFNFDQLKNQLEHIHSFMQQQQEGIKELNNKVEQKIGFSQINFLFKSIVQSIEINDVEFLQFTPKAFDQEEENNQLEQSVGSDIIEQLFIIRKKISLLTRGIMHMFKQQSNYQGVIDKFKLQQADMVDKHYLKEKLEKQDQYLHQKIMEIQSIQKTYSGEQSNTIFQFKQQQTNNHRELERKTIQKIQDFQELISTRVNEEYVQQNIKSLEEKMLQILQKSQKEKEIAQFSLELHQIKLIIQKGEEEQNEKNKLQKEKLSQLKEQLRIKSLQVDQTQESFKDLSRKLQNANEQQQSFRIIVQQLQCQLGNIMTSAEQHPHSQTMIQSEALSPLKQNYSSKKPQERATTTSDELIHVNTNYLENLFGAVDVKQIQIMQQDIKNINKTIETYKTSNDQMQSIIKDKLDIVNFQEQIHSAYVNTKEQQLQDLKQHVSDVVKDILPDVISNEKEGKKVEKLQNDIQNIQDQVENVLEIEKRMVRLSKEFDLNTIIKLINQKANDEETRRNYNILEQKINNLFDIMKNNRMVISSLPVSQNKQRKQHTNIDKKIQSMLNQQLPLVNTNPLIGVPCLSCVKNKTDDDLQIIHSNVQNSCDQRGVFQHEVSKIFKKKLQKIQHATTTNNSYRQNIGPTLQTGILTTNMNSPGSRPNSAQND